MYKLILLPLFAVVFSTAISAQSAAFSTSGKVGYGTAAAPSLSTLQIAEIEQKAFELLNLERVKAGRKPLQWSEKGIGVARGHSANMARYNFFSHRDLNGETVEARASSVGICDWNAIGENIAFLKGYASPEQTAVQSWMRSTGHRSNLLDESWVETAVGVAVSEDGKYYFTQVFLR
mgnify:CR=1 FL=1